MPFTTDDPEIEHIVASELRLLDPGVRRSREACAALLDPDLLEFGSSGRVWDRDSVVDLMAEHDEPPLTTEDIVATRLAPDVVLVTYRTTRPNRDTLRSIWRRGSGEWRIFFHQGTVAASP